MCPSQFHSSQVIISLFHSHYLFSTLPSRIFSPSLFETCPTQSSPLATWHSPSKLLTPPLTHLHQWLLLQASKFIINNNTGTFFFFFIYIALFRYSKTLYRLKQKHKITTQLKCKKRNKNNNTYNNIQITFMSKKRSRHFWHDVGCLEHLVCWNTLPLYSTQNGTAWVPLDIIHTVAIFL